LSASLLGLHTTKAFNNTLTVEAQLGPKEIEKGLTDSLLVTDLVAKSVGLVTEDQVVLGASPFFGLSMVLSDQLDLAAASSHQRFVDPSVGPRAEYWPVRRYSLRKPDPNILPLPGPKVIGSVLTAPPVVHSVLTARRFYGILSEED